MTSQASVANKLETMDIREKKEEVNEAKEKKEGKEESNEGGGIKEVKEAAAILKGEEEKVIDEKASEAEEGGKGGSGEGESASNSGGINEAKEEKKEAVAILKGEVGGGEEKGKKAEGEGRGEANVSEAVSFDVIFNSSHKCSEILDGFLFLGNGQDANNVELIQSLGIKHVLCVVSGWKPRVAFADIQVDFLHLPITDTHTSQITPLFPEAIKFIETAKSANSKILVHCAAGISRSSTIVIAYLMQSLKMSLKEAYELVRSRRSIIRPNAGFFLQLMEFEQNLFSTSTLTADDLPYLRRFQQLKQSLQHTQDISNQALSKEEGIKWAETVVTEEILSKHFKLVGGVYDRKKTYAFLDNVIEELKPTPQVIEMMKAGHKWPKLSLNIAKVATSWYKAKENDPKL